MSEGGGRVRLEMEDARASVVFERPETRNALSRDMYRDLEQALDALEEHPEVRVAVFRGADGHFVSGTDIARFEDFDSGDDGLAYETHLDQTLDRIEALPVPTLAVVEGYAVGSGMVLAAACDLRICTPDARFGMPIARTVGNSLSVANHARLVAYLGPARTKRLLLLADFLEADEARAAGFVLDVVDPGELDARVDAVCSRVASHAPLTMRATKETVRRLLRALEVEGDDLTRRVYGSRDFQEGVEAFLEKRDPHWEGW